MRDHDITASNPQRNQHKLRVEINDPEHVIRRLGNILDGLDETLQDIKIQKPGLESLLEKVS